MLTGTPLVGVGGKGGFKLSDLPGFKFWLDAIVGVTVAGGLATAVADQGPGGYNVVQGSTAPAWSATALNGKPGIVFDGSTTSLLNTTTNLFAAAADRTLFFVAQSTAGPGGTFIEFRRGTGGAWSMGRNIGAPNYLMSDAVTSNATAATAADASPHVYCFSMASSVLTFLQDDVSIAVSGTPLLTADASSTSGFILGTRATSGQKHTGPIGAWVGCDGVLSSANRTKAYQFLKARWGL